MLLLCLAAVGPARPGECAVAALTYTYLLLDLHAERRALARAEAALVTLHVSAAE